MNKLKIMKVVVPLLIVATIFGIWAVKNSNSIVEDKVVDIENPDFLLATETLDFEVLKSYGLPIMIDFGADACQPCKEMAPILEELNAAYQGKVIIKFVDVWKNQELGSGFPLEVIPTQFFFDASGEPFVPEDAQAMNMDLYATQDDNKHVYTAHRGGMSKEEIVKVFEAMGVKP
ncbi:MAG: thioredoxin [Firmicutes bacterium HGW-Firmicutes-3]|jgi:thioredoxin 1|nr:MAG: thioredoxin [Firmicutes bacterium HGW-Firmicutes-3]